MNTPFDIQAKTKGERWLQHALNQTHSLKWPVYFFIQGTMLGLFYFFYLYKPSADFTFVALSVGSLSSSLIYFERYQARRAIERLQQEVVELKISVDKNRSTNIDKPSST